MGQDSCDDKDENPNPHSATIDTPGRQGTANIPGSQGTIQRLCRIRPATWNVVFNAILAVNAIFLGLIAYCQYESSTLDRRAWVGVKIVQMLTFEVGKPMKAVVIFENTGKTPAIKAKAFTLLLTGGRLIDIGSFDFERESKNLKIVQSVSDIFPSGYISIPVVSSTSIEEMEFTDIKSGRVVAYIIGKVIYSDVLKGQHTSWVCVHYDPSNNSFPNCAKYNQSD